MVSLLPYTVFPPALKRGWGRDIAPMIRPRLTPFPCLLKSSYAIKVKFGLSSKKLKFPPLTISIYNTGIRDFILINLMGLCNLSFHTNWVNTRSKKWLQRNSLSWKFEQVTYISISNYYSFTISYHIISGDIMWVIGLMPAILTTIVWFWFWWRFLHRFQTRIFTLSGPIKGYKFIFGETNSILVCVGKIATWGKFVKQKWREKLMDK